MRIGIDFDNTIIDYSESFYKAAKELGFINEDIKKNKDSVKNYLINKNQEDLWTELQGIVYGEKILLSKPYNGLKTCLDFFCRNNYDFFIISHKTKYPYIGKKTNLHISATNWIKENLINFKTSRVFFETSIEDKIKRINKLNLDFFVDDLEKILNHKKFPDNTKKIFFSPIGEKIISNEIIQIKSWSNLQKLFI